MNHLDTIVSQLPRVIPRIGIDADSITTPVVMGEWFYSTSHKNITDRLYECSDKEEISYTKENLLPCIMPSNLSPNRQIGIPTGYACLDFDWKHNKQITDWVRFVKWLMNIPYIVFAGLSASGNGAFAIIAVAFLDRYADHYRALAEDFAKYGFKADPQCTNLNRLRIYSFNDESTSFNNPAADKYKRLISPPPQIALSKPTGTDARKVEERIKRIVGEGKDIAEDYDTWMRIGISLASTFGEQGRSWFHELSRFHKATKDHPAYDYYKTNKKYDSFLKGSYEKVRLGTFFMLTEVKKGCI